MIKISVITAVRNNRDTIAAALNSLLAQTHPAVELVVIDGSSTDGTLDILRGFEDRLGVLVSERDAGIYDALNKGIQRATGDVIGFLHADDLLADNTVLARIAAVFEQGEVDGVYGDLLYVDKHDADRIVRYWRSCAFSIGLLKRGWMPPHPTLYLRRKVYSRYGGFDAAFRIAADYDFMLRILGTGDLRIIYLPQVLVKMRVGGISNRGIRNLLKKSMEDWRALRRNHVGGVATLLRKNFSKLGQFFVKSL